MLVVPIFIAHLFMAVIRRPQLDENVLLSQLYPLALRPSWGSQTDDEFRLAEIPISAVLTQALAAANGTRSRGLLAHALLELQNPELTCFAGLGYGVHLKEMNRGAVLEAFPGGMVPMCGARGRYDEWGRVRGLRYAYQWISTVEQNSLMGKGGEDGSGSGPNVESMLMGWPALLLERAGVSDPLNPVPLGSRRNVYGEAVDRVVGKLCAEGRCGWARDDGKPRINSTKGEEIVKGTKDAGRQVVLQGRSERPAGGSLAIDAESLPILPPFLALYAVARQDRKWLTGAVDQIKTHFDQKVARADEEKPTYWMTTTSESLPVGKVFDAQQEFESQSDNDAWIWAGVVRVLSILEKWKPNLENSTIEERVTYENWRNRAIHDLSEMINTALVEMRDEQKDMDDIMSFCGDDSDTRTRRGSPRDRASTALLVSSVYRLAQLKMLDDPEMLRWADELYNAVARYIGKEGELTVPSDDTGRSDWRVDHGGNEDHSMVVMMWAARRDCVKAGACRLHRQSSRWSRLRLRSK